MSKQWITQEKIDFYRNNGFVQIDDILTPEETAELREYMEEAMADDSGLSVKTDKKDGTYYRVLYQKVNTWRDHAGMCKYSFHPRFSEIALQLTGAKGIRFFHDHALWKMPGDSKPTPWHQDLPYWPMNETGALSIWIALDDVDENNGCMMFVPKSQTAGKLQSIDLVNPQDIYDYVKGSELEKQKPVMVRMKAGSCTFHNGLTFHYAHANHTDKPRRAFAIIYMPDGVTFSGKPHICTSNNPALVVGEPIRGPLFPLLARL